jgi:hypothetical protein
MRKALIRTRGLADAAWLLIGRLGVGYREPIRRVLSRPSRLEIRGEYHTGDDVGAMIDSC